jgi:uncharacterized RDD family membrane protein YckC
MTDPIEGSNRVAEAPAELPDMVPPVADFWQRLFAILIDGAVLGFFGQMLVMTMSPFWFRIGPYGRFVGALIALLYFGLMGSHVGDGRTVAKRMLGIAVRDRHNQPISIRRSMARTLIWLIPATLNGWELPVLLAPFFSWFATAMVFGVGGAVLFTMLFNPGTRQGLHDMVCDTFVVRVDARERLGAFPSVARSMWIASGVFLVVGALLLPAAGKMVVSRYVEKLEHVVRLHDVLGRDPRFFSASVLDQTYAQDHGRTAHTLQIDAWYKGHALGDLREEVRNDIARSALATVPRIEQYDQMEITITSAYDLGFATGRVTQTDKHTIPQWRETVAVPPSRSIPSQ